MPKTSFAQRYLNAWNSHDPDQVLGFFKRNATYTDSGLHQQVQGRQVGHHIEKIIALCPDVHFELLGKGAMGPQHAAIQWRASGSRLHKLCPQWIPDNTPSTLCGLDYIVHQRGRLIATHVYFDLLPSPQASLPPITTPIDYQKTGLAPAQRQNLAQRLQRLMQQEALYLHNDLSLDQLAEHLEVSRNHLSQVINGELGRGFFDWLNGFRVEHAKQLLRDGNTSSLEVAFASGFGSASAFYRAFQQQVQMSPSQFRKHALSRH